MVEEAELDIIELEDNLADVEKPAELPQGWYTAEIQDVQTAISQGKGNKYYAIKCVIPPDEIAADVKEDFPDGATLSWNRQVVPKKGDRRSLFNLRKLIEAMGLDPNTTRIDPNEWMGCRVRVKVRHKPYEGEQRAEIQAIEAAEAETRTAANGKGRLAKAAVAADEDEDEGDTPPAPRGKGRAASKPTPRGARR